MSRDFAVVIVVSVLIFHSSYSNISMPSPRTRGQLSPRTRLTSTMQDRQTGKTAKVNQESSIMLILFLIEFFLTAGT